ncbi:MAG: riboflavin biosynthesis protein RibF [Muribaculum sp.]|nr:riboflavin biosynthesis protein RibF [Muribaculaceae bacterium]MCM1080778.1 riboflavin biosynthesis protein RibF [Muribaculum sp.]
MTPAVATIGNFDGMHIGHQFLAHKLVEEAQASNARPLVFTFGNHPRQAPLLMPVAERVAQLERMGIGVSLLEFTPEIKSLSADEFMQRLSSEFRVTTLLMGFNNHFGHTHPASIEGYVELGARIGINVKAVGEVSLPGIVTAVSSSAIRSLLEHCRPDDAATMLGRPYQIKGIVSHGRELGRTLGFPTANVEPLCTQQLIPGRGVYAARITLYADTIATYPAMLNVGHRPTVDTPGAPVTIEAHILGGFNRQIYGMDVAVEFISYLRPERRFNSLQALQQQLQDDANAVSLICSQK